MIRDRTDEWDMMTPAERSLRKEEAAFAKREQRDAELAGARQAAYDRATADAAAWLREQAAIHREHAAKYRESDFHTFEVNNEIADSLADEAAALERREHVGAATSARR